VFNHINCEDVQYLKSGSPKNAVKKAVPIWLVSSDKLAKWQKSLSKNHHTWQKTNDFKARSGEVIIFSGETGNIDAVAFGTGNDKIDPWTFSKLASSVPSGSYYIADALDDNDINLAAFGWAMAHYKFDHYLTEKNSKKAVLIVPKNCDLNHVGRLVRGTTLARDLVNTPTCDMGPDELAHTASNLAKAHKAKITITEGDALLKKGFNTIHAVGRAAEKEPRLIDMVWGHEKSPKITLVGKGVCFDTGGLDIKPSGAMLTMKKDMGGAAHVLGLGQMIMESGMDVRLRILIPAVENNIAGNAFRPGDIIKSYQGTTIEIGNTDAEGRLVLCDALALASEEKPNLMLDFATLTGAARVALGTDVAPYFTDDKNLLAKLPTHSDSQCDPLWPLPLYTPYKNLLNSSIADLNNVGSTGLGGAITAALFLKHFVGDDIPWAHFDVFGWNASDRPGKPKGGEAMGIRAVFEFLRAEYTA